MKTNITKGINFRYNRQKNEDKMRHAPTFGAIIFQNHQLVLEKLSRITHVEDSKDTEQVLDFIN